MYFKTRLDCANIDTMLFYKKFGYCKYLASLFGFIDSEGYFNYRLIEEDYKKENLLGYLENSIGKKFNKEDQDEIINNINVRVNGRQQRSYSKLNEGLKMLDLPYKILPKKSNGERYWLIEKIHDKKQ